jgi:hypothetical protein
MSKTRQRSIDFYLIRRRIAREDVECRGRGIDVGTDLSESDVEFLAGGQGEAYVVGFEEDFGWGVMCRWVVSSSSIRALLSAKIDDT